MAYSGLAGFITELSDKDELRTIESFVDPELEIAEITDRVTKSNGRALLFSNNGTSFPLLINAYGSDRRMAMAMGRNDLDDAGREIDELFRTLTGPGGNILRRLSTLPSLARIAGYMPKKRRGRGQCQEVIVKDPDLGILPILKCWPFDGGRYITLPIVHTRHPETGATNAGMYRIQVLDRKTTAMHWQRHKTGANHYEEWKAKGMKMPVSVSLGGDPVYAYAATAPLPEGIDEFILAGFLRKKRVTMVRCLTNDLFVPADSDIVIEGYVDTAEGLYLEGPFGDHTGFYSLADWYPKFHVTCITYRKNAVYPATIVGIPPQEDAWIAKATEKIFLSPVKMALLPEVEDFHMPEAGVAHNLVVIKIRKKYPGQGMKVISSLLGAGQMMFSKYMIVVSGETDIRNYMQLAAHISENTYLPGDILFCRGPMDVLDHSSDAFSFGGKMGIDATIKMDEERNYLQVINGMPSVQSAETASLFLKNSVVKSYNPGLMSAGIPVIVVSVNRSEDPDIIFKVRDLFRQNDPEGTIKLILVTDHTVDTGNLHMVAWQVLGNSDPLRDHLFVSGSSVLIDATIKAFRKGGFPRRWPNVVCSDKDTIKAVDEKWSSLGIGRFIGSPSEVYRKLVVGSGDAINS